jgi:hypothetical protein
MRTGQPNDGAGIMDRRAFLKSVAGAGAFTAATPAISQRVTARTLRFVPGADLATFDPIWTTAFIARNASALVFDTLYGVNDKLQPQRQMVEAEEVSADGLIWTFRWWHHPVGEGLKRHSAEQPDHRNGRLLRLRRERPSRHGPEPRDELSPPHLWSPALDQGSLWAASAIWAGCLC